MRLQISAYPPRFSGLISSASKPLPCPLPELEVFEGRPSYADLKAMAQMASGWLSKFPPADYQHYHFKRMARSARTHFILLKDKAGQLVASSALGPGKEFKGYKRIFRSFLSDKATDAYFDHIFIRGPYQHKGLGRWLVAKMTEKAKELGFKRIITDSVNPTSQELLTKMGFSVHGTFKNHAYMTKDLQTQTLFPKTADL